MHSRTQIYDLIITGAGPSGLSAAVEARRAGIRNILILEKGPSHSFSIKKLYTPGKRVDKAYLGQDIPCEGTICITDGTRESVLETMDTFVREFDLPVRCGVEVVSIRQRQDGGFEVVTAEGERLACRTLVVATGVYGRPRRPDYPLPPSLKAYIRFDLATPVPDGSRVLVVGGGNTALEYAVALSEAHPTTLAYRGGAFVRANETNRQSVEARRQSGRIDVWLDADIDDIRDAGEEPRVEAVFRDGRHLRVDLVVYALGGATPQGLLGEAGLTLEGGRPRVDESSQSNLSGLYLAGDLVADGRGSIVKAFNSGFRVVWQGLCKEHLDCGCPDAS